MGIKQPTPDSSAAADIEPDVDCNFTDDTLKIEICGPDRSYFSILDVPGIFQSLTRQLTEKDKSGVYNMVSSYLIPRRSIIV